MELLQTTLCYLEKDGAYLMLHRVKKKNDVNHDKWVGVGGKFEPGEDAPACALREVREETGLTMHAPVYRGIVDFFCDPWPAERMHLYTCTDFSGVMTDCGSRATPWILSTTIQTIRLIGTRKKKIASPSSSDAARLRRHRRRSLKNHI